MKKMSGWQKAGLIAGVGCFSIVAIVVIGVAVAVAWARSTVASLGDPTPQQVERIFEFPAAPAAAGAAAKGLAPASTGPMRLGIDLEGGSFTIRPSAAGGQVRVEGTYAEGLYELTQTNPSGGDQRTMIRFRSKAPAWARMLGGFGGRETRPELTVLIPEGMPLDLSLRIGMGESLIDLGGLALRELELDLSMGNHEVDFKKPVTSDLRRLQMSARMGNVSVQNLGNAHAQSIDATGSMGNVTADLGGAWPPGGGADVSFTHSMGEVSLRVPRSVRLDADVRSEQGSPENRTSEVDEATDPQAPLLKVRVSTSMGEGRIRRY